MTKDNTTQEHDVILLPTSEPSHLSIITTRKPITPYNVGKNEMVYLHYNEATKFILYEENYASMSNPQHLYITSNEEIKDGDWYIRKGGTTIAQNTVESGGAIEWCHKGKYRKIIATTDTSLKGVPQIPIGYINYYVKQYELGNIITKCEVLYEGKYHINYEKPKNFWDEGEINVEKPTLFVSSINTINIITPNPIEEKIENDVENWFYGKYPHCKDVDTMMQFSPNHVIEILKEYDKSKIDNDKK